MLKKNYSFPSLRISIEADEGITSDFNKVFSRFETSASHSVDIAYTISMKACLTERVYYLSRNGEAFFKTSNRFEIIPILEWDFYKFFINGFKGFYLVHACTLLNKGKGFIFPGNSKKGKTTLAIRLLMKGFSYVSDEVVIVDPVNLKAYPFPINLCLKERPKEEFSEFQDRFEELICSYNGEQWALWCIDPIHISGEISYQPVSIDYIIFPDYNPSQKTHLDSISKRETIFELIKNSLNFTTFKKEGIELLIRLAEKTSCYRFIAGEIAAFDILADSFK